LETNNGSLEPSTWNLVWKQKDIRLRIHFTSDLACQSAVTNVATVQKFEVILGNIQNLEFIQWEVIDKKKYIKQRHQQSALRSSNPIKAKVCVCERASFSLA
jgi:hypothetical protein